MAATKIATCCYCGTRAALILRGNDKHELSCSNCGAPLRALKMMPATSAKASYTPSRQQPPIRKAEKQVPRPHKRRKTKSFGRRVFSEIWDVIEDVVEEIFD